MQLTDAVKGGDFSSPAALGTMGSGENALSSLLTLFSGGEDADSQLGIMLLYMLMNSDSDSSYMMLSSLLSAAAKDKSAADLSALMTDAGAYMTDGLSSSVFSYGSYGDPVPAMAWIPSNPDVTGDESCRSSELLNTIIRQFDVENSERYIPYRHGNDTYCNIFVWDVTSALGAEIPHYVDPSTGQPRHYPDTAGAMELDANATCDWLSRHGCRYGWTEVGAEEAQAYANSGHPAVTAWKNPSGGAGHVQVVCPSENGAYDSVRGVTVAQSGAHNCEYTYISSVYSSNSLSQVHYYVHA